MILLQILAGFLIVPLTVLMLILFNVYLMNGIYLVGVTLFTLFYSYLFGVVSLDMDVGTRVFIVLTVLYVARMIYMAIKYRVNRQNKNYPLLRGSIRTKRFGWRTSFLIPLSIFKLLKWLPKAASREFTQKTGVEIELPTLMGLILEYSIGTRIEVVNDDAEINLEIQ